MSILERLTRGVVERNVVKEGAALLSKWSKTGLLEGLAGDYEKQSMAVLLENQAKELLREANTQGSDGNVQGFAAVAFPLVRRVFGGLLANDLVSVQPMSLPSGLIFFLDFTKSSDRDNTKGDSIHGQGVVGSGVIRGVELGENGFYHLSQGYSSARGSVKVAPITAAVIAPAPEAERRPAFDGALTLDHYFDLSNALVESEAEKVDFDPDLLSDAAAVDGSTDWLAICTLDLVALKDLGASSNANSRLLAQSSTNCEVTPGKNLVAQMTPHHVMTLALSKNALPGVTLVRRLTKVTDVDKVTGAPKKIRLVLRAAETVLYSADGLFADNETGLKNRASFDITFAIGDLVTEVAGGLGTLEPYGTWEFESTLANPFGANGDPADGLNIPEIDIKVDSTAITATTRKMKAKWTPELGQDLNAYHNLDAEVELTQVLSEQIALEIDQEILKDLITQATAGKFYWSRVPGRFVNRVSGAALPDTQESGSFTGTVSQWYETLVETINDVSAQIHRKTLRGGANFLVCGPEVANILEFTNGFRASVTHSDEKGTVGATKEGSINKKFDLYVDPYFPRNVILVGRKGSSFLESGYVYAPYVPLQTTPTIFGTEDFTPRKGVMTRYGKKMVRPDMYGLVLVRDMNVITSVDPA